VISIEYNTNGEDPVLEKFGLYSLLLGIITLLANPAIVIPFWHFVIRSHYNLLNENTIIVLVLITVQAIIFSFFFGLKCKHKDMKVKIGWVLSSISMFLLVSLFIWVNALST